MDSIDLPSTTNKHLQKKKEKKKQPNGNPGPVVQAAYQATLRLRELHKVYDDAYLEFSAVVLGVYESLTPESKHFFRSLKKISEGSGVAFVLYVSEITYYLVIMPCEEDREVLMKLFVEAEAKSKVPCCCVACQSFFHKPPF